MNITRVAAVAALLLAAPALGGCDPKTVAADVWAALAKVPSSLAAASETIRQSCNTIGIAEQEALTISPTCGAKVSAIRAGMEAVCRDRALLTNDVVGDYVKAIGAAVKKAKDAQKACATPS